PGTADPAARRDLPPRAGGRDRRRARRGLKWTGCGGRSCPTPRSRGRQPGHVRARGCVCNAWAIRPDGQENIMGLVSLVWGIVALIWMIFALIPLVGITNWLLIPFAAIGAVIAAIGLLVTRT